MIMRSGKPTLEEEERFWKGCGVKCLRCGHFIVDKPESPSNHCCCHSPQLPSLCLDTLRLYAIPTLMEYKANVNLSFTSNGSVATVRYYWGEWHATDSNSVYALFWVLWQVIVGKNE